MASKLWKHLWQNSWEKTSLPYDNRAPGLPIFPLHERESLSATAAGNVYFACASLFQWQPCWCVRITCTFVFGSRRSGRYRKSITARELWTQRKQGFSECTRCTCELSVDLSALLTPSLSVKTMLRAPESPMESVDQPRPLTVEWQRDWKEKTKTEQATCKLYQEACQSAIWSIN